MKNTISTLIILLVTFNLFGQPSKIDKQLKELDSPVQQLIKDYHAAGLAIAVVKDGKTIYSKGFGFRDVEKSLLVDEHTVFGIGSVTKSFTASLFGILEGENKLSLSDRPQKYIPELKFYNREMDEMIRIQDILSHSTGIGRTSSESSCVLFQSDNREDLVARLAHLKPEAQVREKWLYSNYMYSIAGLISERVTGDSWAENLSKMIFQPLNMQNTYAGVNAASKTENFSLGFAVQDGKPVEVLLEKIPTRAPGGDIYSSVDDMTHWLNTWLDNGVYNNSQIIPADYVDRATSPQQIIWGGLTAGNPSLSQFVNYGYGWGNSNYKGFYKIEHSGGISGFTSNVALLPTEKLGIVVLTNQTTTNLAYKITDLFLNKILDVEQIDKSLEEVRFTNAFIIEPPNTKTALNTEKPPTHDLNELTGIYNHPGFGAIKIFYKEETLYAEFPFTTFRLQHLHYNVFQDYFTEEVPLTYWSFMNLNFTSGAEGVIDKIWINLDSEPVEFQRVVKGKIATELKRMLDDEGSEIAVEKYWSHKNSEAREYDFSESDLNVLGYEYLGNKAFDKAITVFQLTVETYPESANAYDSLGEAFMKKGNKEKAIVNYKKSVALNPENQAGIEMLKQMGATIDVENLDKDSEKELITATLMDYIEGTANGEADRLKRAFHPDLNLYAVDGDALKIRSGQKYISIFEDGKKRDRIGSIISIDYENNAAIAKVKIEMPGSKKTYIDYMLLLKIEGAWTIIHKSYTLKKG